MKKILAILGLALLAGIFGLAISIMITGPGSLVRNSVGQWLFQEIFTPKQYANQTRIKIGQVVPAFIVQDFSGQAKRMPKPGHWQVINYWASWCVPCRKEMPLLNSLNTQSAGRYEVIGIALEDRVDAKIFLAQTPITFETYQETPSKRDSSSGMGNAWGVLPFTVLISPDGRLIRRHIGQFENIQQIQNWLAKGLSENQ